MVTHVEESARAEGFAHYLVRANVNAVPLYESLGYARIGSGVMPVSGAVTLPVVFMSRPARQR